MEKTDIVEATTEIQVSNVDGLNYCSINKDGKEVD